MYVLVHTGMASYFRPMMPHLQPRSLIVALAHGHLQGGLGQFSSRVMEISLGDERSSKTGSWACAELWSYPTPSNDEQKGGARKGRGKSTFEQNLKIFAHPIQANVDSAKTLTRLNCFWINKRKLAKYSSSKQNDPYLIFLMVMHFSNETPFVCVVKYVIYICIYISSLYLFQRL